jgi:hypothetical protein
MLYQALHEKENLYTKNRELDMHLEISFNLMKFYYCLDTIVFWFPFHLLRNDLFDNELIV